MESCDSKCRTWNCIRNHSYICKSPWRVRSNIYAGWKYSRKDGNDFSENCYGHSGWRLCNSGSMGSDRYAHRISCNLFHEFYIRHKDEEYQTLVDPVKQHTASSVCCLSCQAYDKKKLWMENAWDCAGNCGKMREG